MQFPSSISNRIEQEIEALAPEALGHINYEGIRHRALPLFGTIGVVWLLRSDGTFWRSDADAGLELEPLPPELHAAALIAGARRYPWLSPLLPARPEDATDCASCGGRGWVGPGNVIICDKCLALGWIEGSR